MRHGRKIRGWLFHAKTSKTGTSRSRPQLSKFGSMDTGGLWQAPDQGQCHGVWAQEKLEAEESVKAGLQGNEIVIKLDLFMVASIFSFLPFVGGWTGGPVFGLYGLFTIWMLVDAIRRKEYLWVVLILAGLSIWYFFYVYRGSASATQGFELPGSAKRKRIKELQAQIYHLDNAVHHFQLGDIYFRQGKFPLAEKCYRAALERDAKDIDARAHLGQSLLRERRAAEARPLLEGVCAEDPKHDYGYSMMALAETLTALGEQDAALAVWLKVTAQHSYPRAKVQLAELYLAKGRMEPARVELTEVLADDAHAPSFQRKRDRFWFGEPEASSGKPGVRSDQPPTSGFLRRPARKPR